MVHYPQCNLLEALNRDGERVTEVRLAHFFQTQDFFQFDTRSVQTLLMLPQVTSLKAIYQISHSLVKCRNITHRCDWSAYVVCFGLLGMTGRWAEKEKKKEKRWKTAAEITLVTASILSLVSKLCMSNQKKLYLKKQSHIFSLTISLLRVS